MYGILQVKDDITVDPWEIVDIDCLGPYTIQNKNGIEYILSATNIIDQETRWFEISPIEGAPTAEKTMEAFDNTWLCRYARPQYVGIDNISEFKAELQAPCKNFRLVQKTITSYNKQANIIIERVRVTLGNMLREFELENHNLIDIDPWTSFLSSATWALRITYHLVLNDTPGQLVFY